MKIVNDNTCSFCKVEIENYQHFFVECLCACQFWIKIFEYVNSNFNVNLTSREHLNLKTIVFGFNVIPKNFAVHLIAIVTKQWVYRARCLNKKPNADSCYEEIRVY